ncbi:fused response regulator/phosphatase [Cognaticolwellia mytili]|uniref:fused response regulator/phosphatase n=1 Tax=Cognaticolwellia mytili TaxID=1888913 RepID=UPI001F490BF2|nr:fused response regulator/phosphatase [Cognaticolwellia mytili]
MTAVGTMLDNKLALVVDDSITQSRVLSHLLTEEGYQVISAVNGLDAFEKYVKYQPDLVLMDINMPVMNGYDAARKIKNHSNHDALCPLVFITNESTDSAYIKSIEAGGDGILVRPFSHQVFKAKIKSIQRISDLYSQLKRLQQEQDTDAKIAEKLMSGVIEARNFGLDRIGTVKKAAALFSGDIQLSALCPNGDVNVLLGDFTGHGLRSSIGALPLAETFRAMTGKGFSLLEIITQINTQLFNLLPADLFLAATFVTVSSHEESIYILNAGLPDAYVFSEEGAIKHKIASSHPPIGVVSTLLSDTQVSVVSVHSSDRVILLSDGIVEARNKLDQMYDYQRFERAVIKGIDRGDVCRNVLASVESFCQGMEQEDDISLVDIPCDGWQQNYALASQVDDSVLGENLTSIYRGLPPVWEWRLSLTGKSLATVNPIPIVMNQIYAIEGDKEHWLSLQTILTELFVNSLDHGVLGLSSDLKVSPEGFSEYYRERKSRLKCLDSGFVDILLEYYPLTSGGRLKVIIKDSGNGFDVVELFKNNVELPDSDMTLYGRGIELVEQLAESLEYFDDGRTVEASYLWAK